MSQTFVSINEHTSSVLLRALCCKLYAFSSSTSLAVVHAQIMQTMLMNVLVGCGCIALRGVICVGFNRGQQKMSIDVVNKLVTFMVRLTSSSKRVLAPTMLALFYRLCFPFLLYHSVCRCLYVRPSAGVIITTTFIFL